MPSILNATTTSGLVTSADNSGSLQLQTNNGTTAVTIDTSQRAAFVAGTATLPAITTSGDTNTGIFFPAADTIAFAEGGAEVARIDSSGNVGIGTSSPSGRLHAFGAGSSDNAATNPTIFAQAPANLLNAIKFNGSASTDLYIGRPASVDAIAFGTVSGGERMRIDSSGNVGIGNTNPSGSADVGADNLVIGANSGNNGITITSDTAGNGNLNFADSDSNLVGFVQYQHAGNNMNFRTNGSERMRINSDGNVLVGTTVYNDNTKGILLSANGRLYAIAISAPPLTINRLTSDGDLVEFKQADALEGTISVSGTTVSYNGGHLARWSQLPNNQKDDTLLKGTVMSNLDDMCVWTKDGKVLPNEQLNKMKVSDVEGDTNVAGVFVNWTRDEDCNSDDMNIAMTGDMIIRIAQGVVVQKGDLLMSAGDGTAKPQGDDIVRSKTIAKVTSNHVTCTYADGSYCVPCVLMAC